MHLPHVSPLKLALSCRTCFPQTRAALADPINQGDNSKMSFQILSLSGGGFFGLYTIAVLTELEKEIKRPIATAFDLS